jgi:O-methyltransferase involved in polyketide biosynthesis
MSKNVSVDLLSGVPRTLLFPVYARAMESQERKPIIKDTYSVDMLEKIDFDFTVFQNIPDSRGFSKKDLQTGIAVRTELLDNGVRAFLKKNPKCFAINMGCGFDARFFRLDNGSMHWLDVDLPEVISIKRRIVDESDRYQMISASVLEEGWLEDIHVNDNKGILLIAEGTLMYFKEEEVKTLFNRLIDKFPKATFLFETMGSALSGKIHPSTKCLNEDIICPWGIHDYKSLEGWNPKLKLIQSDIFIDHHRDRWSLSSRILTWLFSRQKTKFGHAILEMKIQ